MKKKIFETTVVNISVFVLFVVLIKKSLIYESIMYALRMWVNNLIPAMFPFFIISDILINYNITNYIPKKIRDFFKWGFNITDNMLSIFLLSIISGFPSNARNTRNMYDKKMIDLNEANHILMFSHFSNPVFILTTVGLYFFHYEKLGVIILISHYLSNIILGIILRKYFRHDEKNRADNKQENLAFGQIFLGAIKRSVDTVILICGIVTVFLLLSTIVVDIFNLGKYNAMFVRGLFEITIGIEALGKLSVSSIYKAVIASLFLAFGGLSVHMQVMSQITDTDIKYSYFLAGRIIQSVISSALTLAICMFLGI